MQPASRTPEGEPCRCPVCGKSASIEPSDPPGDAPCPSCGHLLWVDEMGDIEPVYTAGEAAKICRVSMQTIVRSFDSGDLAGFLAPQSRRRRIPRHSLLDFMDRHDIPH